MTADTLSAYGIERLDGTYCIDAARLTDATGDDPPEATWPLHMSRKKWVDVDESASLFSTNLNKPPAPRNQLRQTFRKAPAVRLHHQITERPRTVAFGNHLPNPRQLVRIKHAPAMQTRTISRETVRTCSTQPFERSPSSSLSMNAAPISAAGRCLYCDCQHFDNSMGLNSRMDCNYGHPFDCHLGP